MHKPNLGILIKPVSADCNMACDYCYYRYVDGIYPSGDRPRMSIDTFEAVVEQYLDLGPGEIKIGWQGGEPTLMGLDFFRQVIEVERRHARPGDCFGNSLQTNGAVLNDEWCAFLAENSFLVGLSIDGPEDLNVTRKFPNGRSVFDVTMRSLELLDRHNVEYNVLVVVSRANVDHPERILRFLVENDFHYSQFIPCTEPTGEPGKVTEHSITAEQYGEFMVRLFDAWVENDDPSYYVRRIDNWLHQFFGLPPECCEYREDCSNLVTIEWNGDVYPCDFFVDEPYLMGNVRETTLTRMLQGKPFRSFVKPAESIPAFCEDCEWLAVCHAGCYRHRGKLGLDADAEPYLCAAKKRIFGHVFERLRDLIQKPQKPELHAFLNRIGRDVATGRLGPTGSPQGQPGARPQAPARPPNAAEGSPRGRSRNAPCPCGSGRKFKHCCGKVAPGARGR